MATRRLAFACLALVTILSAQIPARSGEVLYNGIELPDDWPPSRTLEELRSGKPMAVPYLKSPPSVIPIHVGRQLFVDDFLIESTTLKRVFHKPVPHEANPILRPNKRWEVAFDPHSAMCFSDGVFFDPQDGLFKLWYRYSARGGTAIAFSKDGIQWEKPRLDDGPQPGTNIVLVGGNRDSATVWLDHDAVEPEARFKLFQFHRDAWQASVHTSPDGIHWTPPTWCGTSGDRSTIFYNPFRKVWVFSIRAGLYRGPWNYKTPPYRIIGRSRLYWESKDFVAGSQWKSGRNVHGEQWAQGQPQYWLACDALDDPPQGSAELPAELYNFDAAPYESLMLGLCSVLHSGPRAAGRPKINSVMLAFSRDGYHFDRPHREAVMSVADDPEAWNYGNVQSVAGGGVIVGDRLYMYASGRKAGEDTTGLYVWRRDGFASMNSDDESGTLTTRPLVFRGRHLFVNLAASGGQLRVELLDPSSPGRREAHKGASGATSGLPARAQTALADKLPVAPARLSVQESENARVLATSKPLMGVDKTLAKVEWARASDLSKWSGQPVRFRFSLRNGALYAFWASPDKSGASHGCVAAGGPGLTGPTDTEGIRAYQAVSGSK